jgi:hypothetical protein
MRRLGDIRWAYEKMGWMVVVWYMVEEAAAFVFVGQQVAACCVVSPSLPIYCLGRRVGVYHFCRF